MSRVHFVFMVGPEVMQCDAHFTSGTKTLWERREGCSQCGNMFTKQVPLQGCKVFELLKEGRESSLCIGTSGDHSMETGLPS